MQYTSSPIQHWECKLIVTAFIYALSASLMWILMEGLYLFVLVCQPLFTDRHGTRFFVILGWRKYSQRIADSLVNILPPLLQGNN